MVKKEFILGNINKRIKNIEFLKFKFIVIYNNKELCRFANNYYIL